ncbi:hypothetical protein IP84_06985 [beta proteobacterium AAP99]|nr:hypothetical protein IP84_06985 [beta proteobacterium AAP99]
MLQVFVGRAFTAAATHEAYAEASGATLDFSVAAAIAKLLSQSTLSGREHVTVWLASGLAVPFVLDVPEGIKGWREFERFARSIAQRHLGEGLAADVWIENSAVRGSVRCIAFPQGIDEQIRAAIGLGRTVRLRVKCAANLVWSSSTAQQGTNAAVHGLPTVLSDPDGATLWISDDEGVRCTHSGQRLASMDDLLAWTRQSLITLGIAASKIVLYRLSPGRFKHDENRIEGAEHVIALDVEEFALVLP